MINKIISKKICSVLLLILLIVLISVVFAVFAEKKESLKHDFSVFENVNTAFADTTSKYFSSEEKIGQMIIADFGKIDSTNNDSLVKLLYLIMPGGIIYKTDSINDFIKYQNYIQKYSKINPFTFFPKNQLLFQFADINVFPSFEILNLSVTEEVIQNYVKVISKIAKQLNISSVFLDNYINTHNSEKLFRTDSIITEIFSSEKLFHFANSSGFIDVDSVEYKNNSNLISQGLNGIVFNENSNSNSVKQINNNYKFKGLFLKRLKNETVNKDSVAAFINAGIDIFITKKPSILKEVITKLIKNEKVNSDNIEISVRKILLAKTFLGIDNNKQIKKSKVDSLINSPETKITEQAVYRNSVRIVKNNNNELPYKNLRNAKFNILIIGKSDMPEFHKDFNSYYYSRRTFINVEEKNFITKIENLKKTDYQIIIANLFLLDSVVINAIFKNNKAKSNVFVNFGKPENLTFADPFLSVLQVYNHSLPEQRFAADALFGGIKISNNLPYKYARYALPDSISNIQKVRISKCLPEQVGLNSNILNKIDSVAKNGIYRGAFPGCQIVVFKNGYNVYDKSFGYQTYAKRQRVRKTDLYDLASITKIAAATTAAMKLYDSGKLRLNDKLGRFFRDTKIDYSNIKSDTIINIDTLKYSEVKDFNKILEYQDTLRVNDSILVAYDTLIVTTTPKNNIFQVKIRDLLLHKSGITPTLPILPYIIFKKKFYDSPEIIKERFYEKIENDTTIKNKSIEFIPRKEIQKIYDIYFSRKYIKDTAEIKIADGFYFKNNWFDTLWRDTKRLRVYSRKIYQYSDINMILLQSAIDSLNRRSMNSYMRNTFYLPMGLQTMCYKPRNYFSLNRIVPTENDEYWREQLLRGNVHDPSAAMLGGISGNAGLFSDAYDLAVLGQMWLNGGTYGGIRYISESTVKKFTGFQEDSHRGLGFDKPTKKAIIAKEAPSESFGHTGFTGTCIWVDPVNDIVFVFLSNRVNPSANNWRINTLKIRQKIHQIVYDAMKK